MNPKISIIIPTYNREKVIAKTLDSVLAQTFKDWECFVVDDHSTDSTWAVLEEYASKSSKIRIFKNERTKGACGARNTGFYKSQSEFVHFFDSDDKMHPTLLEDLLNYFSDGVDVVTCWTHLIDIESNEIVKAFENISEGNIHSALMIGKTYVDTNCALIRRNSVEKIKGWSEDCPSFQEWDFHIRLSKVARYTTLRKHLIDYYVGGADTISKSMPKWVRGKMYILNKFKSEFLLKYPKSYLGNHYVIYKMINKYKSTNKEDADEMTTIYNRETNIISRGIIRLISTVY